MTRDRSHRLAGCLIKFPLGCGAFLVGAAVVTVLFLPQAFGRVAAENLEEAFDSRYAGRLTIGEGHFPSFHDRQRLDDVKLEDPDGNPVLHGRWSGPALRDWMARRDRSSLELGKLTLFDLRIVEDASGTTNLQRALEPREGGDGARLGIRLIDHELQLHTGSEEHVKLDGFEEYVLDLEIERLFWSTPRTREQDADVLLRGVRGRLTLCDPSNGDGSRLALGDRDGKLSAKLVQEFPGGPRRSLFVEAEDADLATLGSLFSVDFVGPFGARAEEFEFFAEAREPGIDRVELDLRADGGDLELRGLRDTRSQTLSGERENQRISLRFDPEGFWTPVFFGAGGILRALEVRPAGPERWSATLEGFVLPLDLDVRRFDADLALELEGFSWDLAPALAGALGPFAGQHPVETKVDLAVHVEKGRVLYDHLALPVGEETLTLGGWHDLATDELELVVEPPASWKREPLKAHGTWAAPAFGDGR